MIDLEQMVNIKLCSSNIEHYNKLGYDTDSYRRPNRDKIMTIPRHTTMSVFAKDLPLKSSVKVEIICDYCKKPYSATYNSYNIRISKAQIIEKDSCNKCKFEKIRNSNSIVYGREYVSSKYTLESARNIFKEHDATLLATEFVQVKELMPYICDLHPDDGIQYTSLDCVNQDNFCRFCKSDALKRCGKPFEEIKLEFFERGYNALYESNEKQHRVIHYICNKHLEKGVQTSFYTNFVRGHGCKECHFEKYRGEFGTNWQGGISELKSFLRENITDWKLNSRKLSNYQCIISGEKFKNIHHLYSFDNIIKEIIPFIDFDLGLKVNQYTKEQLDIIKDNCIKLHLLYGFGVCLCSEIHKLFHKEYGLGNNTHLQFKEFIQRLQSGEFNSYLEENNLTLNLNYESLNKLALL